MEEMEALGAFVENTRFGAFLRELFPGFGDMQVSAVVNGAPASGAEGDENMEVVDARSYAELILQDFDAPVADDYRDPDSYLKALAGLAERKAAAFRESGLFDTVSGGTHNPLLMTAEEYERIAVKARELIGQRGADIDSIYKEALAFQERVNQTVGADIRRAGVV